MNSGSSRPTNPPGHGRPDHMPASSAIAAWRHSRGWRVPTSKPAAGSKGFVLFVAVHSSHRAAAHFALACINFTAVAFFSKSACNPPQSVLGERLAGKRHLQRAPVAQLDRAPDYESGGQRFESFRARHFFLKNKSNEFWLISSSTPFLWQVPTGSPQVKRFKQNNNSPAFGDLQPALGAKAREIYNPGTPASLPEQSADFLPK